MSLAESYFKFSVRPRDAIADPTLYCDMEKSAI